MVTCAYGFPRCFDSLQATERLLKGQCTPVGLTVTAIMMQHRTVDWSRNLVVTLDDFGVRIDKVDCGVQTSLAAPLTRMHPPRVDSGADGCRRSAVELTLHTHPKRACRLGIQRIRPSISHSSSRPMSAQAEGNGAIAVSPTAPLQYSYGIRACLAEVNDAWVLPSPVAGAPALPPLDPTDQRCTVHWGDNG